MDSSTGTDDKVEQVFKTREYFIPGPIRLMQEELLKEIPTESVVKFEDFWQLMEGLCHIKYQELSNRIKRCYSFFSLSDDSPMAFGKAQIEMENQFLEDIAKILLEANFNVVSQEEWDFALEDEFLFTMPFDVVWDKISSDLFPRLIRNKEEFSNTVSFSDKLLLFRRGIGTETIQNYFFMEKIDLIIDRIRSNILEYGHKHLGFSSFLTKEKNPILPVKFRDIKSGHLIDRRSLRDALPSVWKTVQFFFRKIMIQEPTFKEVVVLYSPMSGGKLPNNRERVVEMKAFENIPMGDLEVVLPNSEIELHVKLRDKLQIAVMLFIGVVTICFKFLGAGSGDWITSITILFLIGVRIFQVWNGMRNAKQRNLDEMTRMLYSKSLASRSALLYYLIHSCEEQELKKSLLGYFFLWKSKEGLTRHQLDNICQDFLQKNLGLFVDFDVHGCLEKLVSEKLITETNDGGPHTIYHAVPLETSINYLDKVWDNLYMYNNTND